MTKWDCMGQLGFISAPYGILIWNDMRGEHVEGKCA